jgi:hypothetical protein
MKLRLLALILALPLIAAEPAGYKYWSAAELRGYGKTLASKLNENKIAVADKIIDHGSYFAAMVHREGGTRQKLAAGDIVHIPSKTPHNVLVEPGAQITISS